MKIKNITIVIIVLMAVLSADCTGSCAVSTRTTQGPDDLDLAIREATDFLTENIPIGNRILIIDIQSDYTGISEYITNELTENIVNDNIFTVVEKVYLEMIRSELQIAGALNDSDAVFIGMFLGAQSVLTGAVYDFNERYLLSIIAYDVQTSAIQGQFSRIFNTERIKR